MTEQEREELERLQLEQLRYEKWLREENEKILAEDKRRIKSTRNTMKKIIIAIAIIFGILVLTTIISQILIRNLL